MAKKKASVRTPGAGGENASDPLRWPSAPPDDGQPQHHPMYYLDDGNVVLLVEKHLYKIHRYFLQRESAFFTSMFTLPQAEGEEEGRTDEKPIPLGGAMQVTSKEMESLCNFLYYGMHDNRTPPNDEWSALLSIASKLDCADLRRRAISELDDVQPTMEPFDRVTLAIKYHVEPWLAPAYEALCMREKPLSFSEGYELGLELAMAFAEARERIKVKTMGLGQWGCHHSLYCQSCRAYREPPAVIASADTGNIVKEVFRL